MFGFDHDSTGRAVSTTPGRALLCNHKSLSGVDTLQLLLALKMTSQLDASRARTVHSIGIVRQVSVDSLLTSDLRGTDLSRAYVVLLELVGRESISCIFRVLDLRNGVSNPVQWLQSMCLLDGSLASETRQNGLPRHFLMRSKARWRWLINLLNNRSLMQLRKRSAGLSSHNPVYQFLSSLGAFVVLNGSGLLLLVLLLDLLETRLDMGDGTVLLCIHQASAHGRVLVQRRVASVLAVLSVCNHGSLHDTSLARLDSGQSWNLRGALNLPAKGYVARLLLACLWLELLLQNRVLGLFLNVAVVNEPFEGDYLVHVVYAHLKVHIPVQLIDLLLVCLVLNVVLKVQSYLLAVVLLDYVREAIRQLVLSAEHPSDQTSSSDGDFVDALELHVLAEALLYKSADVKQEIHPDVVLNVGTWDSSVGRLSVDVVLAVSVVLSPVEDKSPLLPFLV